MPPLRTHPRKAEPNGSRESNHSEPTRAPYSHRPGLRHGLPGALEAAGSAGLRHGPPGPGGSQVRCHARTAPFGTTAHSDNVEDTENAFELKVTECIWASVFRDAGLDGEIGHAAVCNMDYTWPTTFNPKFKMERDRTLMQGHDHCNHRYVQVE